MSTQVSNLVLKGLGPINIIGNFKYLGLILHINCRLGQTVLAV